MHEENVPADYTEMDLSQAKRFDKKVRENFMPAILSTVKQVVNDYGPLEGVAIDVGCGTAIFAIELCKKSALKIQALEKEKAIHHVACNNIEAAGFKDRINAVIGDAHDLPFDSESADFAISRGAYHCWHDKVQVFKEICRVLKKGGIGLVGGGFGRYVSGEELNKMKMLRDRSLEEDSKAYNSPELLKEVISKVGISDVRLIEDPAGYWAEIRK
ncbi:MAG: class I SAM-dependent methyltransferase [Planctomycetota bacterium]